MCIPLLRKICWIFLLSFITSLPAVLATTQSNPESVRVEALNRLLSLQIPFIENVGQIGNSDTRFYAKSANANVFLQNDGALRYALYRRSGADTKRWVLEEHFSGAHRPTLRGQGKSLTQINYFKGSDSSRWLRNVPAFDQVSLGTPYPGIELNIKATGATVEKIFSVAAHADPGQIRATIRGAQRLRLNAAGELEIETGIGTVKFTKPVAYQEIGGQRQPVSARYALQEDAYGFKLGEYDRSRPLIIDPLLASRFHGGSDDDRGFSIAKNATGVYVVGESFSEDLSVGAPGGPSGSDWSVNSGFNDAFVSMFSTNLHGITSSTYLGGSSSDRATAVAIDDNENIYVTGWTYSDDFPTTFGTYQPVHAGWVKAFVTKFNKYLNEMPASTYLGGNNIEDYVKGHALALTAAGEPVITGEALAPEFPTTPGAYDPTWNGEEDVFVAILDPDLEHLLASTFLGGDETDVARSIVVDPAGNIYLGGRTESDDFPANAYDSTWNGGFDAFIARFDGSLQNLLASTYLGGSNRDEARGIHFDGSGTLYLAGETFSSDFPTTAGAYDTTLNNSGELAPDAFVSKLSGDLQTLHASTFFGGSHGDEANAIAVDASGDVYLGGSTDALKGLIPECETSDFPTTPGAYDRSFNDGDCVDAFVAKLDSNLRGLMASTLLGGEGVDVVNGMFLDGDRLYLTGETSSADFPIVGISPDPGGEADAFVAMFDSDLSAAGVPPSPSDLVAAHIAPQIHITWVDNSNNESGFLLEMKEYPGLYPVQWQVLATLGPNTTSFQMDNPTYNHTYHFRVSAFNGEGPSNYSNEDTLHVLLTLSWISIDSPNGGESWEAGSTHLIEWGNGIYFRPSSVSIKYSIDGGSHWVSPPIAENTMNDGSYLWSVPDTISNSCIIKVQNADGDLPYDLTDHPFAITAAACPGDFDEDGDVDGTDLAIMSADFGRTDCGITSSCPADFDNDGDVDGSDLAIFSKDFGRIDCP